MSTTISRTQRLASLRKRIQDLDQSKGNSQKKADDRHWKLEKDAAGNGSAIIRFLPAKTGEEFDFVQLHTHGFQGPTGKWFIDNCPTSIGENCPVCKANTTLWNSGVETDKKLASSRKRKLSYISNILVVNDPKHPENNGKVFLFRYGKKIYDKITEMINPPEFADITEPIDPFDPEHGTNFKLRMTKQDGFPNYDRSSFETTPAAIGDEDYVAEISGQLYSLNEIVDPSHFKSFEDLKRRFDLTNGGVSVDDGGDDGPVDVFEPETSEEPVSAATPKRAGSTKKAPETASAASAASTDDDFFAKLVEQSNG